MFHFRQIFLKLFETRQGLKIDLVILGEADDTSEKSYLWSIFEGTVQQGNKLISA